MANIENFYGGTGYGLSPDIDSGYGFIGYRTDAASVGLALDPRTANQLREVSDKLSTGARTIEVQGVQADVLESIPRQHFKEMRRLKELTGSELTFHGPLIEPSGLSQGGWNEEKRMQGGWNEEKRMQAERQMWNALEKSHDLEPKGNIAVTFHTTSGIPEMKSRSFSKEGDKITELLVINERDGNFSTIRPRKNYLTGSEEDPEKELDKLNKDNWFSQLSQTSFHARQGQDSLLLKGGDIDSREELEDEIRRKGVDFTQLYKLSGTEQGQKLIKELSPGSKRAAEKIISQMNYGDIYVKDSYQEIQNLYNQAWESAHKSNNEADIRKLEKYREEIAPLVSQTNDPAKLPELSDKIVEGVRVLSTLSSVPRMWKPLNDFTIEKSAETFSNLALRSYKKFRNSAPIISIENPPAGGGLSRAEDMKELIEKSQENFINKATEELGMSRAEAERQAKKLIGATWDVGHINMLRKYGYGDKEIVRQTKKIAPYVKHVHLSDNFGYEHTELPMGMGNVPTKEHLEAIQKYNDKVKKIVETGNWYQHFQVSPYAETLAAFGSPIYSMKMGPYWNQQIGNVGGYFAGYGLNPDIHHSVYGAGFAGLPLELGGQVQGASRLSGTPTS